MNTFLVNFALGLVRSCTIVSFYYSFDARQKMDPRFKLKSKRWTVVSEADVERIRTFVASATGLALEPLIFQKPALTLYPRPRHL